MPDLDSLLIPPTQDKDEQDVVDHALETVRKYLGMEIAYLSEFVDDDMVVRAANAPGFEQVAKIGAKFPLSYTYCRKILAGDLPEVIPNTGENALAATLPITEEFPIGSHVSVPIRRPDGSAYGMFCCLSRTPNDTLNERDLEVMRAFASVSANQVNTSISQRSRREEISSRLDDAIENGSLGIVYQPIFDLFSGQISGFESLSRFETEPKQPPNVWFGEAAEIGRGIELELHAIDVALRPLRELPSDCYISVNASPETLYSKELEKIISTTAAEQVVIEMTEHVEIKDYQALETAMTRLRLKGVRIAIDDCGAGYSGLQQIVRLKPDIIKLDISLTSGIDQNSALRSLAAAMVHFAGETGAAIVAEGIENDAELETLRALKIHKGQGYLLGRPNPFEEGLALLNSISSRGVARAG